MENMSASDSKETCDQLAWATTLTFYYLNALWMCHCLLFHYKKSSHWDWDGYRVNWPRLCNQTEQKSVCGSDMTSAFTAQLFHFQPGLVSPPSNTTTDSAPVRPAFPLKKNSGRLSGKWHASKLKNDQSVWKWSYWKTCVLKIYVKCLCKTDNFIWLWTWAGREDDSVMWRLETCMGEGMLYNNGETDELLNRKEEQQSLEPVM